MDEPDATELDDPHFRTRFTAAYTGRHHPEDVLTWLSDPSRNGAHQPVPPAVAFRQLTSIAYKRMVDPTQLARLKDAQRALEQDARDVATATAAARRPPEPPPAPQPSDEATAAAPHRHPRRLLLTTATVAAAVTAGAAGYSAGASVRPAPLPDAAPPPSAQEQIRDKVAASTGDLVAADYYRLYPDDLPLDWGGGATGASFRALAGHQRLPLSVSAVSRSLLIVVTCPKSDTRFTWALTGERSASSTLHRGRCGEITGQQTQLDEQHPTRPVALTVSVNGPDQYGVTVLER